MVKAKKNKFISFLSKIFCVVIAILVSFTFSGCFGPPSSNYPHVTPGGDNVPPNTDDIPSGEETPQVPARDSLEFIDNIKALYVKDKVDDSDRNDLIKIYDKVSEIILSGLAIAYGPGFDVYLTNVTSSLAVNIYEKIYKVNGSGLIEESALVNDDTGLTNGFLLKEDPLLNQTIFVPSPIKYVIKNGEEYNPATSADTNKIIAGTYNAITNDNWKWVNSSWNKNPDETPDSDVPDTTTFSTTDKTITKKLKGLVDKNISNLTLEIMRITSSLDASVKPNADFETLFNGISHIGFFGPELQELKDFVLNEIIGKDKVAEDDSKIAGYGSTNPFVYDVAYTITEPKQDPNDPNEIPVTHTYIFDRNYNGVYDAPPVVAGNEVAIDPSFKNYRGYVELVFDKISSWLLEKDAKGRLVNIENGKGQVDADNPNTPTVLAAIVGTETYKVTSNYDNNGTYLGSVITTPSLVPGVDGPEAPYRDYHNLETDKDEREYYLPRRKYMLIAYEFKTEITYSVNNKKIVEELPNLWLSFGRYYIGDYLDKDESKFFKKNNGIKGNHTGDLYPEYDVFYNFETIYNGTATIADPDKGIEAAPASIINKETEPYASGKFEKLPAEGDDADKITNGKAWLGNMTALQDDTNSMLKTGISIDAKRNLKPAVTVDLAYSNFQTKTVAFGIDATNIKDILMILYAPTNGYADFSIFNLKGIGLDTVKPELA